MQHVSDSTAPAERKFLEAIARKRLIVAEYNGSQLHLAPHQLFTRHGELFVSAFNTGKNWRDEGEFRLGHYKLEGLSNVSVTESSFEPLQTYDGTLPRAGDQQLFAIAA
jgi:hypothetical protein